MNVFRREYPLIVVGNFAALLRDCVKVRLLMACQCLIKFRKRFTYISLEMISFTVRTYLLVPLQYNVQQLYFTLPSNNFKKTNFETGIRKLTVVSAAILNFIRNVTANVRMLGQAKFSFNLRRP